MADSLYDDNQPSPEDRDAIIAKWKDKPVDELLSAKAESDLYIKTLIARQEDLKKDYLQLREQHQASEDLKTMIDQLRQSQKDPNATATPQADTQVQHAISPEDIDTLVSQKLNAHQLQLKQQENFNVVQARLKETLGPDYQSSYKQRLDTLGLTKEFADDLAKNHPSVFLKTFDLEGTSQRTPDMAPPRSQQRQASFKPSTPKRDWNYYQELKKSNPRLYLDPKIAIQMHDDAIALGDAFGMPED